MWKIGKIKRADKIRYRIDPCLIFTSALEKEEMKLFYKY